jgi:hypothetical protein
MTTGSTGRKRRRKGGRREGRMKGRYSVLCFVASMCGTGKGRIKKCSTLFSS